MDLKRLIHDDDAVSPVIGVILMVAITVILAAVIATFVLGLGDSLSSTAPQATFSFEFEQGESGGNKDLSSSGPEGALTITHDGGDSIEVSNLEVTANPGQSATAPGNLGWSGDVSAGSSTSHTVDADATVRVLYNEESAGSSATLGKWEGPNA